MNGVSLRIDANDTRLKVQLESMPRNLRRRLEQTIRGLTNQLLAKVRAAQPRRTGLLRKQTHAYVDVNKEKQFVRGRVRVLNAYDKNIAAAFGALEYGSTGKWFGVSQHWRQRRGGDPFHVTAHQRSGGLRAHYYLRGPARSMLPEARRRLQQALQQTIYDTQKE